MSILTRLLGGPQMSKAEIEELDEWERHHDDPRSQQGFELFTEAVMDMDLTLEQLNEMWRRANALVGKRAPADYGEFLVYGYLEGRKDALTHAAYVAAREKRA